jgi:hypothetical protein
MRPHLSRGQYVWKTSMSELNERPTAELELTDFSRTHLGAALALFAAERWQAHTTAPIRGFRLGQETIACAR